MWMRGTEIECKLSLPKKSPGSVGTGTLAADMQNCFSFVHLPARKTFSPHLTTAAAAKYKQTKKSREWSRSAHVRANTFPVLLGAAWHDSSECPATLEGVQSIICSTAWEQEGCLRRQRTPASMLKCHRALLCLLCPQLREEVLFHLFWQLLSFPFKPLKLSCGCVTWDAKGRRNWVGINSTKIWKHKWV